MQPGAPRYVAWRGHGARIHVQPDSYGRSASGPAGSRDRKRNPGTNQWHGRHSSFCRNNVLDAPDFFDQGDAPPFRRNQFGASMGVLC